MLNRLIFIAITALFFCLPLKANESSLALGAGVKFAWDNYKTAVMDYTNQVYATNASADQRVTTFSSIDYPSPRFGGNLQLIFNRRLVLGLDLDFGAFTHKVWPYPDQNAQTQKTTHKFFRFGTGVNAKFFLTPPKNSHASAYLSIGLGKVFAKTSSKPNFQPAQKELDHLSKLASPIYGSLAFGAEFFIADSFSIGADVIGLRFEHAKASTGMGTPQDDPFYTGEQKYINMYLFSALTMNFSFAVERKPKTAPQGQTQWGVQGQTEAGWETGTQTDQWGNTQPQQSQWGSPPPPQPLATDETQQLEAQPQPKAQPQPSAKPKTNTSKPRSSSPAPAAPAAPPPPPAP